MPRKVLLAVPSGMLQQVDHIAQVEHRTRSDLCREALRRYIDVFRRSQGLPVATPALVADDPYIDLQPACGGNGTE
jgi:metal-responsive CopG/Arc/MetJ family transcriptional regulator